MGLQPQPKYLSKWVDAQAALAWLALKSGSDGTARAHLDRLWEHASDMEVLPLRAALCTHEVWRALGDARGGRVIAAAAAALRGVADHISDRSDRKRFLDENPIHRRILALSAER